MAKSSTFAAGLALAADCNADESARAHFVVEGAIETSVISAVKRFFCSILRTRSAALSGAPGKRSCVVESLLFVLRTRSAALSGAPG